MFDWNKIEEQNNIIFLVVSFPDFCEVKMKIQCWICIPTPVSTVTDSIQASRVSNTNTNVSACSALITQLLAGGYFPQTVLSDLVSLREYAPQLLSFPTLRSCPNRQSYIIMTMGYHCNDCTWLSLRQQLMVTRLFVQHVVQATSKGRIEEPHFWPIGLSQL